VSRSKSFVLTTETEIDASTTASPGGAAILSDEWNPLSSSQLGCAEVDSSASRQPTLCGTPEKPTSEKVPPRGCPREVFTHAFQTSSGPSEILGSTQPVARLRRRATLRLLTDLPVVTAERSKKDESPSGGSAEPWCAGHSALPLSRGGAPVHCRKHAFTLFRPCERARRLSAPPSAL